MQNSSSAPDEPLVISAPLAREVASVCCARAAADHSCEPYHGFWQYMRLMGLGKTLSGQSARYLSTLDQLAGEWAQRPAARPRQVLISGCADYSMLAHVLHACGELNPRVAVTVLDVCPTPLFLNEWYARRVGQAVTVVCADILQHRAADAYDLIVTSSFLGYFSPEVRPRLFRGYAAMLRAGGRLVFANRIRPGSESEAVGFSPPQTENFAARAAALSAVLPAAIALEPGHAVRMARSYAQIFTSYPLNGEESVRTLARASGLRWVDGSCVPSAMLQAQVNGPSIGDGSDYVFVNLEK
jgi:SAM-dependent methyltransferase